MLRCASFQPGDLGFFPMLNSLSSNAKSQLSDNRPSGARNIGALTRTRTFQGFVGVADRLDYYLFRVTGRSSFNLSLNRLQNNVDVFLMQGNRVINSSTKGGKKPEAIADTLEAGTYYVQVRQRRGNSQYRLTLNATLDSNPSPSPSPNPSPSPTSSRLVSLFSSGSSPRLGSINLSTGVISPVPVTGSLAAVTLTDIAASGTNVYAVSIQNNLYQFDPTTGGSNLVGSLGVSLTTTVTALGFTPSGTLYTANDSGGFYTVDLTTGRANLVASIPGFSSSGDLTYDATSGRFFAVSKANGVPDSLYSIGLAGDARLIGNIGFSNVWGLLLDNGILYGHTSSQQQIVINPSTGVGTLNQTVTGVLNPISGST